MPKTKKTKSKKIKAEKTTIDRVEEAKIREESIANENTPIIFSWETVDFIRKPLTEFYFKMAAAGAMAMIVWGLYDRNFVMIITFIVMVIVIILALNDEPRKVAVKISESGIDINNDHHNFSEFRSFKISHIDELPVLIFKPRKNFSFFKNIYIENEPANDLESFLGIFLEKEEEGE